MPAMTISLTRELELLVDRRVKRGLYPTALTVIAEACGFWMSEIACTNFGSAIFVMGSARAWQADAPLLSTRTSSRGRSARPNIGRQNTRPSCYKKRHRR